jgi:hypothetical protein
MPKLLTFQDLLSEIPASESTLRREISNSRKGIGNFPLPISESKRKLLFHPDDIERWMNSHRQSPPSIAKVESETQRQRRYKIAMKALEQKGVKTAKKRQDD